MLNYSHSASINVVVLHLQQNNIFRLVSEHRVQKKQQHTFFSSRSRGCAIWYSDLCYFLCCILLMHIFFARIIIIIKFCIVHGCVLRIELNIFAALQCLLCSMFTYIQQLRIWCDAIRCKEISYNLLCCCLPREKLHKVSAVKICLLLHVISDYYILFSFLFLSLLSSTLGSPRPSPSPLLLNLRQNNEIKESLPSSPRNVTASLGLVNKLWNDSHLLLIRKQH